MNRFGHRLLVWSVVLCFAVFFGVELATRGITDTGGGSFGASGSRETGHVITADELMADHFQNRTAKEGQEENASRPQEGAMAEEAVSAMAGGTLADVSENAVESMADTAGRMLRVTAQKGVEFVVGMMDALLQ